MTILLSLLLAVTISVSQSIATYANVTESACVSETNYMEEAFSILQPGTILDRAEGTIYIGDSRFVQMDMYLDKGDSYVIAKVSQGYKWLVEEAIPMVNEIKESHPEIASWTIVSNLGVNDLHNIDKYLLEYQRISECGDRLILISVNPCDGKRNSLNTEIDNFNTKLSTSEFEYLDTASYLKTDGFSTSDGVHYTKDTYIKIWNRINLYLNLTQKRLSGDLGLFN